VIAIAAVAALLVTAAPIQAATRGRFPMTWTFPGQCATIFELTLQACIDGADPGDTIHIATDAPIAEAVVIDKSLTLDAASGSHPTVGAISIIDAGTTLHVTVHDLATLGLVKADLTGGTGHFVALRRLVIHSGQDAAVLLRSSVPAAFEVTSSAINSTGDQADDVELVATQPSGLVSYSLVGNRLDQLGSDNGGSGIDLRTQGGGSTTAVIDNNTIFDVARCRCGGSSGILMSAGGSGQLDADVVGNTIDQVDENGILVHDTGFTGHMSLDVFDDIVATTFFSAIGLGLSDASRVTFRAGNNDRFDNGSPDSLAGFSAGSGNLLLKPRFVNAATGDLRLKSKSKLIDQGVVCSPGGVSNLDAAGNGRLAGASVDMGAFEFGAVPTNGGEAFVGTAGPDVFLGTPGNDIMCGYGGDDALDGAEGDDYIAGGAGNDLMFGRAGADRLKGGPGDDTLCARDDVNGNDHLNGGTGNDGFAADPGDPRINVEHAASCL
jgi:Ca2+-binding RTX toxin-like protein